MIQEELRRFLAGDGFFSWGIELLKELGHDVKVVQRLATFCKMDYAPQSAENELVDILRGYVSSKPLQVVEKKAVIKVLSTNDLNIPKRIREIEEQKVRLLKSRADWHTRMRVTTKQDDRAFCTGMVLGAQKDLDRVYAVLDNYFLHGIEPIEVQESQGSELINLANTKGNLASRISTIKRLLKNEMLSETRRQSLITELSEKELKFKEVKGKLKSV